MLDKTLLRKTIQSMENFERVAIRAVKAAEEITSRVFSYAWALWHIYLYFAAKH